MLSALIHLPRLARVGFVLAREGALALVDPLALPAPARLGLRLARLLERRDASNGTARLAAALTRLGPSYVKFGQFMATRPDVVGLAVARDLEALQDRMAPFPRTQALAAIEIAFGRPWNTLFQEIGEPVAAASIAQVHRARDIDDGHIVALKVARPDVERRFLSDLETMRVGARLAERFSPDTRRLKPAAVVETLARSVAMEMDFRLEAAAASEMGENVASDDGFRVPSVDWSRTARGVLTLEWIDGTPMSDLAGIDAAGHDRKALARAMIQSFLRHALRDGFFHADMHPGNLFVDPKGNLVAVDFGIMGRLGRPERRFLAEILLGFITRDYRRVAEVHFEAGYVPPQHSVDDFAQAIRAIGEPIHQRRADQISMAKLLGLLFEVTALFDMQTRTELVMLQKTMVVVEGVSRNLDPAFDMWSTAEPVVREWIERHLGPVGRIEDFGRNVAGLADAAGRLPALVARSERVIDRLDGAGIALDARSVSDIGQAEARGNRAVSLALWTIAALLLAIWLQG